MSIAAGQRWTHVKRGTNYEVIGIGELQMSADLVDGSSLVVYRGDDGKLWAREEGEFLDGRFEPARMTPTNDAPVTVTQLRTLYEGASLDARYPGVSPDAAVHGWHGHVAATRASLGADDRDWHWRAWGRHHLDRTGVGAEG